MKKVSIDRMAFELARQLALYTQDVADGVKQAIRETARECRDEIREKSPRRTGEYKKNWVEKVGYESEHDLRVTVHNKKKYRLTHLLENGHAINRGGKRVGRAKARPHIASAEENAVKKLKKKIAEVVKE